MKRNPALLLIIAVAAFVQTPAVAQKPAAATSTPTVKVVPAASAQSTKPSPAGVKVIAVPAKPAVVSVQPSVSKPGTASSKPATKPASVAVETKAVPVTQKKQDATATSSKPMIQAVKSTPKAKSAVAHSMGAVTVQSGTKSKAVQDKEAKSTVTKESAKPTSAAGRRDPFISPVVKIGAVGSGCSSGKRCLAIDQIALKGIVKSDTGMIAVVVNSLAKAYFLRENDPVFNGYVLKITGDSIVFKESFRDRLGKPLTRDVTKTIVRPVA